MAVSASAFVERLDPLAILLGRGSLFLVGSAFGSFMGCSVGSAVGGCRTSRRHDLVGRPVFFAFGRAKRGPPQPRRRCAGAAATHADSSTAMTAIADNQSRKFLFIHGYCSRKLQAGWGLVQFSAGNRVWRKKRRPKAWTCPLSRRWHDRRNVTPFSRWAVARRIPTWILLTRQAQASARLNGDRNSYLHARKPVYPLRPEPQDGWQTGQKKVDRWAWTILSIRPRPQRRHASPARW